jgi:TRAP transporter 4TM/12TM fusion protein
MGLGELVSYVGLDTTAMLGRPIIIAVTIVIVFIFLGRLLLESGAADFFTDISAALLGRSRGGSAKIAVAASAMFGSVSGSAVSNVATTGILTIPMMCKGGYSPRAAAAIEAVASTGGQLAPPVMGAAAFLMAEFLQLPYRDIVVAAIIPAVLFYAAVFIQTDLEAARLGVEAIDEAAIPKLRAVVKAGWHLVLPFVVLVGVLFWLNQPPETAALAAAVVLFGVGLLVSYAGHKLKLVSILSALRDAGYASVDIVVITAAAGIIIGILDRTGLSFGLGFVLVEFGQDSLFLLLVMTALLSILLGMGMPTTGVYFLLAALAAPPLIKLGIEPIAAHMFVLYFGMLSMITPPVAIAAFTAANLAGTRPMPTAATAVRFGWPAYIIPFLFVLSPTLLMQGSAVAIVLAVATALVGVWAVTAAIAGHLMTRLSLPIRLGFGVAGLALLIPPTAFGLAPWLNVAGGAVIIALILPQVLARHRRHAA